MINISLQRQAVEALIDLLEAQPGRQLHDCTAGEMAAEFRQLIGVGPRADAPAPRAWVVTGDDAGDYEPSNLWLVGVYTCADAAAARCKGLVDLKSELERALKIGGLEYYEAPEAWAAEYKRRAGDENFSSAADYEVRETTLDQVVDVAAGPGA